MSHKVYFDDVDLSTMVTVSTFDTPMLPATVDMVDVPGMDGQRFMGTTLTSREVRCTVTLKGASRQERYVSALTLKKLLRVKEPEMLWADWMNPTGDDEDVPHSPYYLAVPRADTDPTQYVNGEAFEIVFVCPDPVAYDGYRSYGYVTVGTAETTVTVEGNMPARPVFYGTSCLGDSSGVYRITNLDTGEFLQIEVSSSTASTVSIDCMDRVVKVAGVVQILSPLSTWFELDPGETRLQVTAGSGSCSFDYVARWL